MKPLEPHWDRDGDDPGRQKGHLRAWRYACRECCWHGPVEAALKHMAETTHDVRLEYVNRQRRTA